ncbi:MAG: phosphatidate cytidylyltransferase [Candidatus Aminicenantes bacterium]|nr:phosphatidate cytidylyltransferase [Candidatus Aminicenantes bacterium]
MWKKLNAHKRLPTALILIAAVVALVQWAPHWLLAAVIQFLILGALWEFYGLARKKRLRPHVPAGGIAAVSLGLPYAVPAVPPGAAFLAALTAVGIIYLFRANTLERVMDFTSSAAVTLFGAAYLSLTLSHFLPLRREFGPWAVYFLLAAVSAGDTGAFLVGSLFGRHKMFPLASPKKTWEGAAGGLVFAVLGAMAARALFFPELSMFRAAGYGLAVHCFAQISDPLESLFKRAAGVKDSGRLFPGHGGLLDRVDSFIFSAPLFYYLMHFRP